MRLSKFFWKVKFKSQSQEGQHNISKKYGWVLIEILFADNYYAMGHFLKARVKGQGHSKVSFICQTLWMDFDESLCVVIY